MDECEIFIEYLSTLNLEFSAICTQESCISDNDDLKQVELKSYKLIPQGKSSSSIFMKHLNMIINFKKKKKKLGRANNSS